MANYPQLDDCSGVWTLKQVHDAVAGGYWRNTGSRGVFGGGFTDALSNVIQKVNISTSANATDFGDLASARKSGSGVSSHTRAMFGGSYDGGGGLQQKIEYVTMSTDGNAANFGNLSAESSDGAGMPNSTRGVFHLGYDDDVPGGGTNVLEYITMASTGNTTDFGDATTALTNRAGCSSPTKGLLAGGVGENNIIEFITIANTGNGIDFGDLTASKRAAAGSSSSTRGVFSGGLTNPAKLNVIEFVTIASQGNAIDYGDLTVARTQAGGTSNSVRSLTVGGNTGSSSDVLDFVNITNGGTATDFGNLIAAIQQVSAGSQAHGGLNDGYQGTRFTNLPFGKITSIGVNVGNIGLFNGGEIGGGNTNIMSFINIASTSNASDWGDLVTGNANGGATASETRYVTNGDNTTSLDMNYVEFATKGNTALFGDLTVRRHIGGTGGNKTRGIMYSGFNPDNTRGDTADSACNVIDFITYASLGNATNFGDANVSSFFAGGHSSATRTLKLGGISAGPATLTDSIEFVTTASAGNGSDFGNLLAVNDAPTMGPVSSSTRGVTGGGSSPSNTNVIQFVTIASAGDATDFGDLTVARSMAGGACSATRGTFAGGESPQSNVIDFITIASAGNASDFGDLPSVVSRHGGNSNGNGGLS